MRPALISVVALSAAVSCQLVVPLFQQRADAAPPSQRTLNHNQKIMDPNNGPGPALPPDSGVPSRTDPPPHSGGGGVILSDVIGRDRSVNLFAGFIRNIESTSVRLDDPSKNTTVLAPLNSAVEGLPRKPWEDPREYGALGPNAYEGGDGHERAQKNIQRFVEAHLIPVGIWSKGQKVKTLLGDREVWWEEKEDGTRVVQPGDIEVVEVSSSVANGEVWILKKVRNYA
ncbi:uncharacterized protein PODANS_1_8900 [Podospora anserina S mat+]|uniref:Podospora anserina S mat+ genomic DNA chromosome 1, supercontig 2 n=1 Tax=Podospora anserina (strain S / ATCC MYA-4624 / DSM 980 / FGSC 10383) TaxID=515849 RepID=B2AXU8_PODAN|nr:uncharacterized protein PODANS_1_8900 [Podospora anserina S mat+]CAP69222.1 unnamed protein product [Podospora anserina S mat+]CDP23244.1 Putative protein of unknown function [Podospora anserina S mat+]